MASQMTSNMFSGPCFGDSTPSESSSVSEHLDSPTSSPLVLQPAIVQITTPFAHGSSDCDTYQIGVGESDPPQGQSTSPTAIDQCTARSHTDLVSNSQIEEPKLHLGLENLEDPLFPKPSLPDLHFPLEAAHSESESTAPKVLGSKEHLSTAFSKDLVSPRLLHGGGQRTETMNSHTTLLPHWRTTNNNSLQSALGDNHLTIAPSHSSHSDFAHTPLESASPSRNPAAGVPEPFVSSPSPIAVTTAPIPIHPIVEKRTGSLANTSVEIFKSSEDDDIRDSLSRSPFYGKRDGLHSAQNRQFAAPVKENHVFPGSSVRPWNTSNNMFQESSPTSPDPLEYGITSGDFVLASSVQSNPEEQSHEKAAPDSGSDQSQIPSSSPIKQTECSQSNPYSPKTTTCSASNLELNTDAVGTNELPSSSPPPSPSMSSNYIPSSSPLPSSSPTRESNRTPPTSPSRSSDAYSQPAGHYPPFYPEENYPANPYAVEGAYYLPSTPHDAQSSSYMPMLAQPNEGPFSSSSSSSFPLGYYPHSAEQPDLQDIRFHENVSIVPPFYPPTPVETSISPAEMTHKSIHIEERVEEPEHRQETQKTSAPGPKRSTLAAQRVQHKKLSKPFRSPVVHAPVRLAPKPPSTDPTGPIVSSANSIVLKEAASRPSKVVAQPNATASSSSQTTDSRVKHRTKRAASQFKSPLSATSEGLDKADLVRLTPTIQSLERKLQLLRRALKVREDMEEEVLEGLVKKWSDAGKEVAWEVWDMVKDNAGGDDAPSSDKGKKRAVGENWGWEDSGESKKAKVEERNWGWDVVPIAEHGEDDGEQSKEGEDGITDEQVEEEAEAEEAPRRSLGSMLMELGIAPETLGWDEEEGTFTDN